MEVVRGTMVSGGFLGFLAITGDGVGEEEEEVVFGTTFFAGCAVLELPGNEGKLAYMLDPTFLTTYFPPNAASGTASPAPPTPAAAANPVPTPAPPIPTAPAPTAPAPRATVPAVF